MIKYCRIRSKILHTANVLGIKFEFQKNGKRDQSVHIHKTTYKVLKPVFAWGETIERLVSTIPGVSEDNKVCKFNSDRKNQR